MNFTDHLLCDIGRAHQAPLHSRWPAQQQARRRQETDRSGYYGGQEARGRSQAGQGEDEVGDRKGHRHRIYAQAATNKAERDAALTPRPRRRFIPLVKPEIEVSESFYLSWAAAFCKHTPYILSSLAHRRS